MKRAILAFLILALAPAAGAAEFKGECAIRFKGISTLHDFYGTGHCRPFQLTLAPGPNGKEVLSGVRISVPVGEMDTKNEERDVKMREMFQADKFPFFQATLEEVDPDKVRTEIKRNADGKGTVGIKLKIRDVERPVRAVVKNLRETAERITFDAEFPVSLKEYGLKPPSVLFGMISVRDDITLTMAFRLEAAPPK